MIVVVSQAFTRDAGASARAYVEGSRAFLALMQAHPGFRGRKLMQSREDPTHFTHLRWFDSVEAYEALTRHPDYDAQIAKLSAHLDLARYAGVRSRELMDEVLDEGEPWPPSS